MIAVAKRIYEEPKPRIGCPVHGTPEGQRCNGCQQRELFSRAEVAQQTRDRRWS